MPLVKLNSILDNDFYKITMQNAVVKLFPSQVVKYKFINRGAHGFPENFGAELRHSVNAMAELRLTKDEKIFMVKTCPYIDLPYLDFLEGYRYDPSEVHISQNGTELEVTVEGLWYRTILWEVPLLSLISELHYVMENLERNSNEIVLETTLDKARHMKYLGVTFAE
ncbi:MAG: nicotinate phosphoribosyltransferase, partial [Chryseobacterium sp.]|nr:nicotinate phosphoribosyltransferase [Chryseobacterium sp.]